MLKYILATCPKDFTSHYYILCFRPFFFQPNVRANTSNLSRLASRPTISYLIPSQPSKMLIPRQSILEFQKRPCQQLQYLVDWDKNDWDNQHSCPELNKQCRLVSIWWKTVQRDDLPVIASKNILAISATCPALPLGRQYLILYLCRQIVRQGPSAPRSARWPLEPRGRLGSSPPAHELK